MQLKLSKESTYIIVDGNNKPVYKDGFVCTFKTASDAKKVIDWNQMADNWKIVAVKQLKKLFNLPTQRKLQSFEQTLQSCEKITKSFRKS